MVTISHRRDYAIPKGFPAYGKAVRAPPRARDGPSSRTLASSDSCWWRTVLAHYGAAIARQLVVPDPALGTSGCVADESPGTTVSRCIALVVGALVVQPLTCLYAAITGATAQGNGIGREVRPPLVVLVRVTNSTSYRVGSSYSRALFVWCRRVSACRHCHGKCGRGRSQHRTGHACGGPRHTGMPLSIISWKKSQVPRSTVSLGSGPLRCGDYARFHRFPAAFLSLAAVHGRWLTACGA
jgi:hypothetical protein